MKIAVVILNWNGVGLLEQFLPSVLAFSPEATVYVADNASTDTSVAFVKVNFPSVKIIENLSNFGFAKGYNEALQFVDADIFALVNSDIEVTRDWLLPIIETFENEPQTAIIQPKIRDYKNKEYFEYAGGAGGFIDRFGYPFCRGRVFETVEKDEGQYDDDIPIFWASGACFFIRSDVYKALGGFDESFFAHQEEIDLCWRAFNQNHSIKYCHQSLVYHVGGATLQTGNPQKTFLNFRNSLLMLTKNVPGRNLFIILFARMLLDGVAAVKFLVEGQFSHFVAVLKAHFHFYHLFASNFRKRQKKLYKNYYKVKSIVYLYYIGNGKVFGRHF